MGDDHRDVTPDRRRLLDEIAAHGLSIVHVPDQDGMPAHSYTVGMWHSFDQPEVIVFGLPEEIAAQLLDAVADEAAGGAAFAAGTQRDDLLVGYPVRFAAVDGQVALEKLSEAAFVYEARIFPCLQLVWPDKQGRWPWQPGVRDGFARAQPVLGRIAP